MSDSTSVFGHSIFYDLYKDWCINKAYRAMFPGMNEPDMKVKLEDVLAAHDEFVKRKIIDTFLIPDEVLYPPKCSSCGKPTTDSNGPCSNPSHMTMLEIEMARNLPVVYRNPNFEIVKWDDVNKKDKK